MIDNNDTSRRILWCFPFLVTAFAQYMTAYFEHSILKDLYTAKLGLQIFLYVERKDFCRPLVIRFVTLMDMIDSLYNKFPVVPCRYCRKPCILVLSNSLL